MTVIPPQAKRIAQNYKTETEVMKKVAVAAILCGASHLALAQSSVELYGIVDTGFEYVSNVGVADKGLFRATQLTGQQPSRWGFKGAEDLGGGLKAIFRLENGFSITNGQLNQGGRLFGRSAYVGLSSNQWGTLTFGRQQEMLWTALLQADNIGSASYSMVDFDPFLASAREDNSVAYTNTVGGFTLGATYSLGRDTLAPGNCAGQQPGDGVACRAWSAMLQYNSASWGASVAYDEQRGGGTSSVALIPSQPTIAFKSSSDKDSRFLTDAFAKFGDLRLGAGWIYRRLRADAVSLQTNLFFAGATYPVTPSVVLDGQYVGLRSTVAGVRGDLAIARVTYLLSKRSSVYVAGAHMFNGHAATFSVSSTSPVPAAPVAGRGQTGVMVGLRQLF
ncbi:putative porin [Paraburkholderia unamae]|uniref:Porin n=2 Tax=Paraburkholderia unamae TaxID=219649 RepID=A0ABX5KPH5_9BURK|nr:putative porin [Paraburkholderia unamae]